MQMVFDVTPGECPECGIAFADDFRVYRLKVCRRYHLRGVCVACSGLDNMSLRHVQSNASVANVVGTAARYAVWETCSVGFPSKLKGHTRGRVVDEWPTSLDEIPPPVCKSVADKLAELLWLALQLRNRV